MKHLFVLVALLALAGTLKSLQAGSSPQTAPAAPAGKTAEQQKADQSECVKWAKQQAGLSQPDAQQPATTTDSSKAGAASADQAAPAANQGGTTKPADNAAQSATSAAQSATSSGTSSAISAAESKLGVSGAANSKLTQLAKDAYNKCMEKKGYQAK